MHDRRRGISHEPKVRAANSIDQVKLGGPSVKQSIREIDCSDGRHRQCVGFVPLQPLARRSPLDLNQWRLNGSLRRFSSSSQ